MRAPLFSAGLATGAPPEPLRQPHGEEKPRPLADFSTGKPDLYHFPRAQWAKSLSAAALLLPPAQFGYTGPRGYLPLCEEIAGWLSRSRGLAVCADDIFITAGATHALRILTDLLCQNGGRVMLERSVPQRLVSRAALLRMRSRSSRRWTATGFRTELLTGDERVKMIYVTPSHQFPLGGILPAPRRAALIRYARENNAYIVEDDYDSEFRYSGSPVAPLYSLDPQCVIYVGTFSKTAFPALRVGFVILPHELQRRWCELRTHHDVQNPPFEQAALR